MDYNPCDYIIKLLLLGDSGVGKTSLLLKFVDKQFEETFVSTIGVDFKSVTIRLGNNRVKLQIWDTAGQERFRTITSNYYRGAHGIVLVYDVTNRQTFYHIKDWIQEITDHISSDITQGPEMLLVANKMDLVEDRTVQRTEGIDLAKTLKIPYIETSSKHDINIRLVFEQIAYKIIKKMKPPPPKAPQNVKTHKVIFNKLRSANCCHQ